MSFLSNLKEFRNVIAIVVVAVTSALTIVAWAGSEFEQQQVMMEAKSAVIHNEYYQENRIANKRIEMAENERELRTLLRYIGDDTPTSRQDRQLSFLDSEIARLKEDIEEIRVQLETK